MEEKYRYSSLGIYLGLRNDEYGILDPYFALNQFSNDLIVARKIYQVFVRGYDESSETEDVEFRHERAEYRSERSVIVRNISPEKVVEYAAAYIKTDKKYVNIKYIKDVMDLKALS